jgi:flagellin
MALSINTNIAALNAYRNLNTTTNDLSKSLEKLSSGFRINRAADDAAGLAISEGMRSQIGGMKMGVRNAQDGISVVQTAEGALNETHSILQRMRDLSVQGANAGSLNASAKTNIQTELGQLKNELTRISDTTTFNGQKLLDGNYTGSFQVGANVGERIGVAVSQNMNAIGLGVSGVDVTTAAAGVTGVLTTPAAAGTAGITTVDAAGDYTTSEAFELLNGTITVGSNSLDLSTVKYAAGSTAATRLAAVNTALTRAGMGAGVAVATATATGIVFTGVVPTVTVPPATGIAAAAVNFTRATGADGAILAIDAAITLVSSTRSDLGAVQNRFEHTINNSNVAVENLTASESRIRDTDMASEMVSFTRSQILKSAGTAMLAQAKSIPQGVLQLLQ